MEIFKGSGVAIVTPFHPNGAVHYDSLSKLIEFQLTNGTDAIIICGTTGEASTLTDDEQIEVIRFTVDAVRKRAPVIAGAGSNYTEHGIALCKRSQAAGADACMLVTPYYNKTTPKGLVEHYQKHAAAVDIPIIIYNVPSRTGLNITPKTAQSLSRIDTIAGIKEASGSIVQVAEIAELCGDRLALYAGNDDYILPVLSLGGKGVISVAANVIPRQVHDLCARFFANDLPGALHLQLGMLELVRGLFCEVNPIPVKAALNMMGYDAGGYRAPLTAMEPENEAKLRQAMCAYGLLN
ncbi:MAG: 4-hydroxy-tetrahydrodipicolinate synthase [Clostridiales bacterium]|jgi:4-hydroxy-tetrahydrodipicolinate synthase|nr:4-hydroxy-tetrahydrodipicolinate synthase [Clostridiales bacterium]